LASSYKALKNSILKFKYEYVLEILIIISLGGGSEQRFAEGARGEAAGLAHLEIR
jgi:hypothetical protein